MSEEATYQVNAKCHLVVVALVGYCSLETRLQLIRTAGNDPATKGCDILVDLRRCSNSLTADEIRIEREVLASFFDGQKMAVVVERELQFGMTRIGGSIPEAREMNIRPFYDYQEALQWLRPAA